MEQLEIFARKPEAHPEDLEALLGWLGQIDDWATADQLLRWMGWPANENGRRRIRALAEASGGRIASGPGAPGYILTAKLRPEDLHFIEGLKTQSDRMRKRYTEIVAAWHRNPRQ